MSNEPAPPEPRDAPVASERKVLLLGLVLDLQRHRLTRSDGADVELRPQAMALLCELAAADGRVLTRNELFARVWPGVVVTDDSLVQAVSDARRALRDDAHRVIQTVPRRGYRLVADEAGAPAVAVAVPAPVAAPLPERIDTPAEPAEPAVGVPEPDLQPARRSQRAVPALIATLSVLVVLAVLFAFQRGRPGAPAPAGLIPDRPPIAVLAFRDPAASAEDQAMARAYAIELIGELSRNADLQVITAFSSFALSDRGDSPRQVAAALGTRYLVDGQLRREGDRLRLTVQLIDGADGRVVWAERDDVAASQVYVVRDALVDRIAGSLHSTLRRNTESAATLRPPASLDVYALTLRAITLKHRFGADATREARALLERVIALDPGYAPGWLYLGYVNTIDLEQQLTAPRTPRALAQAQRQIERSIELNPNLPPAYAALLFLHQMNGRFADAVTAGRRCTALGPSDAECSIFLASALVWNGAVAEALVEARRAVAMNPIPPVWVLAFYGEVLWANRDFDAAVVALDDCLRQVPGWNLCRIDRMVALAETGRLDAARADAAALRSRLGGASLMSIVDEVVATAAAPLLQRRLDAARLLEPASPPGTAPR